MKRITQIFSVAALALSTLGCSEGEKSTKVAQQNPNGTTQMVDDPMDYRVEAFNGNVYQTVGAVKTYDKDGYREKEISRFTDKATGGNVTIIGPAIITDCDNCPVPATSKAPRPDM